MYPLYFGFIYPPLSSCSDAVSRDFKCCLKRSGGATQVSYWARKHIFWATIRLSHHLDEFKAPSYDSLTLSSPLNHSTSSPFCLRSASAWCGHLPWNCRASLSRWNICTFLFEMATIKNCEINSYSPFNIEALIKLQSFAKENLNKFQTLLQWI